MLKELKDFEEESIRIIEEDEEVIKYVKDLELKTKLLEVVTMNTYGLRKWMHPFRYKRTEEELNRLSSIKDRFYSIKKSPILRNIGEETGDILEDLEYASYKVKPGRVKTYMRDNKIR